MRLPGSLARGDNRQHALVLGRDDLHKVLAHRLKAVEQLDAARTLRRVHVLLDERTNLRQFVGRRGLELNALVVHTGIERAVLVKDIGHATCHAGGEVLPDLAQDERQAARHVLAAVVAAALDHHGSTGVAHAKALAGQTVNEAAAARGAKERNVAHDDVLVELVGRMRVGAHRHLAARKALAKVVIGVTAHVERNAARQERAKALTSRSIAIDGDGAGDGFGIGVGAGVGEGVIAGPVDEVASGVADGTIADGLAGGTTDGEADGVTVGLTDGLEVGVVVGLTVGLTVGAVVGLTVGLIVGAAVGLTVGLIVGAVVGLTVGSIVGAAVGLTVGVVVGLTVGLIVGAVVGLIVGFAVGAVVAGVGVPWSRGTSP